MHHAKSKCDSLFVTLHILSPSHCGMACHVDTANLLFVQSTKFKLIMAMDFALLALIFTLERLWEENYHLRKHQ